MSSYVVEIVKLCKLFCKVYILAFVNTLSAITLWRRRAVNFLHGRSDFILKTLIILNNTLLDRLLYPLLFPNIK